MKLRVIWDDMIADEKNFITEAHRVVLKNEQYFGGKYELWIPTDNDIQEALDVWMPRFLNIFNL